MKLRAGLEARLNIFVLERNMEKTALVTGSTNNIGKAIAETLSRQGFHVVVTSRHEDEAKAVAANLPVPGSGFRTDFSDVSAIESLFGFIKEKLRVPSSRSTEASMLPCRPQLNKVCRIHESRGRE